MNEYLKYWNVTEPVFLKLIDVHAVFCPTWFEALFGRLKLLATYPYTVTVITAPSGYGKSTLVKLLYQSKFSWPIEECEVLLLTPSGSISGSGNFWLMEKLATFLGTRSRPTKSSTLAGDSRFSRDLVRCFDEIADEKRKFILIIDAAENLVSPENYAELVTLFNLHMLSRVHISVALFGRPTMLDTFNQVSELSARLACKVEMPSLDESDTARFVDHMLERSSLHRDTFDHEAKVAIFAASHGIFTKVNAIAENCLIEAYFKKSRSINADLVKTISHSVMSTGDLTLKDLKADVRESRNRKEAKEKKSVPAQEVSAPKPVIGLNSLFKND